MSTNTKQRRVVFDGRSVLRVGGAFEEKDCLRQKAFYALLSKQNG
jgi:hypothetical protein